MKIESTGTAFDDSEGELATFKALKQLTLYANTREEAEFLAKLRACIRRGDPDIILIQLVERLQR